MTKHIPLKERLRKKRDKILKLRTVWQPKREQREEDKQDRRLARFTKVCKKLQKDLTYEDKDWIQNSYIYMVFCLEDQYDWTWLANVLVAVQATRDSAPLPPHDNAASPAKQALGALKLSVPAEFELVLGHSIVDKGGNQNNNSSSSKDDDAPEQEIPFKPHNRNPATLITAGQGEMTMMSSGEDDSSDLSSEGDANANFQSRLHSKRHHTQHLH
ncbi:hypothetical protein HBI42_042620 [Parastagonospora nodorum]|nr:hypothetical protein HBI12_050150 [Parastagonospora nodorum]KAH6268413.1 hypothetical protein HBI42_042620 [Parastagonospora nodorum]